MKTNFNVSNERSKDGQRMAYFTETVPATICDIVVQNGSLTILPTSETVPQE